MLKAASNQPAGLKIVENYREKFDTQFGIPDRRLKKAEGSLGDWMCIKSGLGDFEDASIKPET